MHEPFQREPPSDPDHWLHDTSVYDPVRAPWPEGKNAFAPPVSSQMSKLRKQTFVWVSPPSRVEASDTYWTGSLCWLLGLLVDCPHHSWLPATGQRSVTLTMIVLNGPVNAGEYGSAFAVMAKQRPHASPGPRPGNDPNASWLTAAV